VETETIVSEEPEAEAKTVTAVTTLSLSDFKIELDLALKLEEPRTYVKTVYWEIRRILAESLGIRGETSETPREYNLRVADTLGIAVSSLSAITQIFEIAEYSQHVISPLEAQEARNHALRVAEEVNMRIKH
jgi:hypothetical protein